jgi:hypothetical protein
MNKIFIIGFPKSGTTSIHASLASAGISAVHWATDNMLPIRSPYKIIVGTSIKKAKDQNKSLLSELNAYQAFTQMETCMDEDNCYWPQLIDVPTLHQQYPDSRFIFNDRKIDSWIKSLRNWNITTGPIRQKGHSLIERIIKLDVPGLPSGKGGTDQELKNWYIQHKNNMLDFFKNKDNFILFNIETNSGNKLGEFLNIPNLTWRHLHKSHYINDELRSIS